MGCPEILRVADAKAPVSEVTCRVAEAANRIELAAAAGFPGQAIPLVATKGGQFETSVIQETQLGPEIEYVAVFELCIGAMRPVAATGQPIIVVHHSTTAHRK